MQVKKCLAVFSLMMIMCLSVLPSFASAEVVDILRGKTAVGGIGKEITDGKYDTCTRIFDGSSIEKVTFDLGLSYKIESFYVASKSNNGVNLRVTFQNSSRQTIKEFRSVNGSVDAGYRDVRYVVLEPETTSFSVNVCDFSLYANDGKVSNVTDLKTKANVNDVELTWKNPSEDGFSGVNIYKDNELLTTLDKSAISYVVSDLKDDTMYKFKVSSLNESKVETKGVETSVKTLLDPKKVPPGPVSSLVAEPTDKTVKLKWKKPNDDDLAGFKILQNGKQIAEIGLEEEFTVKNLESLTEYNFGVVAVDKDKNDSSAVNLSVKTLEEKDDVPPHVPSNVFAKPSNGALIASWDKVSDKDLAGYNVYLDGKKINSNLISSTNFTIKNLENNRKYKVQVQAVDRSGNASELSLSAFGTPDTNTIPIIESKYSLEDVSDGVGVMFSQLWLVLAFAVGIPLAFYIIYKLKHTVLP
ncbi:fibronectin type III domain-containing protein (plasmid) [Bacillus paramycoides]|uniref:fibronectin type III domain-containing protein n=1 Tax=Bacillus paramycoides TaxID=2026194 RepID=UPI003183C762